MMFATLADPMVISLVILLLPNHVVLLNLLLDSVPKIVIL